MKSALFLLGREGVIYFYLFLVVPLHSFHAIIEACPVLCVYPKSLRQCFSFNKLSFKMNLENVLFSITENDV